MLVSTTCIFADHHQFYIFDSDFDHFNDPALNWTSGQRLAYGYLAVSRAIYVGTDATSNVHRLRIFLNEDPCAKYERIFASELSISSGSLTISAPANSVEDDLVIPLRPGRYQLLICSSAIGADELTLYPDRDEPMADDEIILHDDFEYYDLFIRPLTENAVRE